VYPSQARRYPPYSDALRKPAVSRTLRRWHAQLLSDASGGNTDRYIELAERLIDFNGCLDALCGSTDPQADMAAS